MTQEGIQYATHAGVYNMPWCLTIHTAKIWENIFHADQKTPDCCCLLGPGPEACDQTELDLSRCWVWWNLVWKTPLISELGLERC